MNEELKISELLKANALNPDFMSAMPLEDGVYIVETDSEETLGTNDSEVRAVYLNEEKVLPVTFNQLVAFYRGAGLANLLDEEDADEQA